LRVSSRYKACSLINIFEDKIMKNVALIIFLLFLIYGTASPQSCLPEGIIFETQEEIDNFKNNYPGCTVIEGDVEINGYNITNLNGLNVLTAIGGYLHIVNNDNLTSLTGLDDVTSIGGAFRIWHNDALTGLIGLDNLTSIGGDLGIIFNPALTSLTKLDNVTSIGWRLWIGDNDALTSLTGLDNVTSIEGDLSIYGNDALTSLTGLDNFTSIGGDLSIHDNYAVTSLSGLNNIDAASIDDLLITFNGFLSTCEVQSICDYLAAPDGSIIIYDNATGCNSEEEVEAACAVPVESINPENEISIFPNPANNQLTISCKDGTTIEKVIIYNQIGQIVLLEKPDNNIIDISELQPGMYIIEVVSGQRKVRGKLVIE